MHYLLFIVGLLNLGLGIFVLAKKPKAATNLLFFLFSTCASVWTIFLGIDYYLLNVIISNNELLIMIINKIIFLAPSFIPALFVVTMVTFNNKISKSKKILSLVILLSIPFVLVGYFVPIGVDGQEIIFNKTNDILFSVLGTSLVVVGLIFGIINIKKIKG